MWNPPWGQPQALGAIDSTLEDAVTRWMTTTGVKCTPGSAFNNCATFAPHLAARLAYWGFPAERLKIVGLRVPLGPYAHKNWRALDKRYRDEAGVVGFVHHAVLVGDRVVDPTGAQFGKTFPLFSDVDEYLAKWNAAYILDGSGDVIRQLK